MNETVSNESPDANDEAVAYDWERPMSPNSMFSKIERNIIIACINITLDENYFGPIDFVCMFGSEAKPIFAKIIEKLEINSDLDKEDGYYIGQAVLQISAFYSDEVEKQFESQFALKMYQLSWFPTYIQNGFAIHSQIEDEQSHG